MISHGLLTRMEGEFCRALRSRPSPLSTRVSEPKNEAASIVASENCAFVDFWFFVFGCFASVVAVIGDR